MKHSVLSSQTADYHEIEVIPKVDLLYAQFQNPNTKVVDDRLTPDFLKNVALPEFDGIVSRIVTFSPQCPVPGKEALSSIGFVLPGTDDATVDCVLVLPRYNEHGNRMNDAKLYYRGNVAPDPRKLNNAIDSIILILHAELQGMHPV